MRKCIMAAVAALILAVPGASALEYQEAPELAAMVAAGTLPPIEDRLPTNPLVWENDYGDEIGAYGGQLRFAEDGLIHPITEVSMVRITSDNRGYVPYLAESFVWNEDYTKITFHIREGVKWSDGVPFTTDDIAFWWNDIIHSKFLADPLPFGGFDMKNDKLLIDDALTFSFEFAKPNPNFLSLARKLSNTGTTGMLLPKHFWTKFHPGYVTVEGDQTEAFQRFRDAIRQPYQREDVAEVPVLWPWRPVAFQANTLVQFERNPYFFVVDKEGQQLPYINSVSDYLMNPAEEEQIKLRILAGEIDFDGRTTRVSNIPLFQDNAERANIRLTFTLPPVGSMQGIYFGYNNPDEKKRELFRNPKFRQALSLAIDRDHINDVVAFGLGVSGQGYSAPGGYDPAIDGAFAELDLEKAGQLLDEIGLSARGADGFRLLPDGERLQIALSFVPGWATGGIETAEAAVEGWRAIGVDAIANPVTHQLRSEFESSGNVDAWLIPATGGVEGYALQWGYGPRNWARPQLAAWNSGDKTADGIDAPMAEFLDAFSTSQSVMPYSDEFMAAAAHIRQIMAKQIYVIGVVADLPQVFAANKDLRNIPGAEEPGKANLILGQGDSNVYFFSFFYDR